MAPAIGHDIEIPQVARCGRKGQRTSGRRQVRGQPVGGPAVADRPVAFPSDKADPTPRHVVGEPPYVPARHRFRQRREIRLGGRANGDTGRWRNLPKFVEPLDNDQNPAPSDQPVNRAFGHRLPRLRQAAGSIRQRGITGQSRQVPGIPREPSAQTHGDQLEQATASFGGNHAESEEVRRVGGKHESALTADDARHEWAVPTARRNRS
jgi:hypothetical protein